jgi:hypothetical protein
VRCYTNLHGKIHKNMRLRGINKHNNNEFLNWRHDENQSYLEIAFWVYGTDRSQYTGQIGFIFGFTVHIQIHQTILF